MDSWAFKHTFADLGEDFSVFVNPSPVKKPQLILWNSQLAKSLGVSAEDRSQLARFFSGNELIPTSTPIAAVYAGHQFGHLSPRLGDGRAILLGEVEAEAKLWDVQLKGSGITPFSRGGDGRAALGPVLREYLMCEAMHSLGVPTTRALAAVLTGQFVYRDRPLPGAIVTRVAASHLRVGSFEYFARTGQHGAVMRLADYAIERHFPELAKDESPYWSFFCAVAKNQAKLVSHWMGLGFIHGVMNTDNTSISGETIDYGPCAFLDRYDPDMAFSSIDSGGRYAYGKQSEIIIWNLARLAECLLPLFDKNLDAAVELTQQFLSDLRAELANMINSNFAQKLGLKNSTEADQLIADLLNVMARGRADFTLTFRSLSLGLLNNNFDDFIALFTSSEKMGVTAWLAKWRYQLASSDLTMAEVASKMLAINPAIIARNHQVEAALQEAYAIVESNSTDGAGAKGIAEVKAVELKFAKFERLFNALKTPFDRCWDATDLSSPPNDGGDGHQTFCGT